MARVYANMYKESERLGLDSVGGPSFTKAAAGTHSVRYFISRLSMWIANTALAAYSKIVFVVFDFELMPQVLANFGITGLASDAIVWMITGIFIAWTIMNVLFEQRMLKIIGYLQIALTAVMVVILAYQALALGAHGSWNFTGILNFTGRGNWVAALVINTGYLYLLFFGFQEIQAMEHEALETSSIPIVSWIKRSFRLPKSRYLGLAMIMSVVIAATINILYGLAVFSLHPDYNTLVASQIPALYISNVFLGPTQELLTALAFLIATITTFVPSFLAASRHLAALGEDGFLPQSLSRLSYGFTLAAILILALGDENFLISITDFLVLISLGLISLSQIWLQNRAMFSLKRTDFMPLAVGLSCFFAGVAQYFISSSVAIFGSVAIAVAYLIYDIYELGSLGSQLFLGVFDGVVFLLLALYPHSFANEAFFLFDWLRIPAGDTLLLSAFLIVSLVLLFANLLIETVLKRVKLRSVSLNFGK
jgi:amino acid transporter